MDKNERVRIPASVRKIIVKLLPFSAASFLMLLIFQGIALLSSIIMQQLIDVALPQNDMNRIVLLAALFIAIPIVSGIGSAFYQYISAITARKYSFMINEYAIRSIIKMPMTFHDRNNSGELVAQIGRDASGFILLWVKDIPEVLSTLAAAAIALYMLFQAHPTIGFWQLLYIPCILLPSRFIGKRVSKNAEKIFANLARMRSYLQEIVRGIKIVKINNMTAFVMSRYKGMFLGASKLFAKTAALETFVGGISTQMISSMFTGIGFVTGIYLAAAHNFTMGNIVLVISLLPKFHAGLNNVLFANINYMKQMGEYRQLFSYLENDADEAQDDAKPVPDKFMSAGIEFADVSFSYKDDKGQTVSPLRDVSATFPCGKWISIEGPSGIGKTTLVNLLLRLYAPDSGQISLDGVDVREINLSWYLDNMAYVGQTPFLFTGTVRDNFLAVVPNASEDDMLSAMRSVCLEKLIEREKSPLDIMLGEDGTTVSGGEKQRLALAIAILSKRQLLILDEVTSNLDTDTQDRIARMLRAKVDAGFTILSISHRSEFNRFSDLRYAMDASGIAVKRDA